MSIKPTGSPLDNAQGTLSPGWPVISKGAVLVIIEYGDCESWRDAFIGVVGITSASHRLSASS